MPNYQVTRTERRKIELEERRQAQKREKERRSQEQRAAADLDRKLDLAPWVSALIAACIVALAIGPLGIINPAYPVAGDQVTHNWWLVEFRDRLLSFRGVFGWTNDLSLGYLFGFFYFPLPPIVFSVLSFLLPDAVSIKLMVAGSLTLLPLAALRLARGLQFPRATLGLVPLVYLASIFSNQPLFVGGTLYSTLTGEFSYAYGLAFSMLAVGEALLLSKESGGTWWRTGLFLGAAVLSHILASVPAVFIVGWILFSKLWGKSRPAALSIGLIATAVASWWVVPSLLTASEALGDGHKRVSDLFGWLFPLTEALPLVLSGFAGLAYAIHRRRPGARFLALLAASGPLALLLTPGSFMWNVRIMPWYYAALAVATVYLFEPIVRFVASRRPPALRLVPVAALVAGLAIPFVLPDNVSLVRSIGASQYGGASLSGAKYVAEVTEYLKTVEPGRAMVALPEAWSAALPARDWVTALPLHTDGRITSAISLYYEASKSTPGIEYVHSHVSEVAHTSLSWLGYGNLKEDAERVFATGVRGMEVLGIRYYIVGDQKMYDLAIAHPSLRFLDAVGEDSKSLGDGKSGIPAHQWGIFELVNHELVESITTPVGVQYPEFSSERDWASASVKWLSTYDLSGKAPFLVEEGPEMFDAKTPYPPVVVSDVELGEREVSFKVSEVGTPVLVKVSHSKQWKVRGATGPYRAAPNLMVVIPTQKEVVLVYENPVWTKVGPLVSLAALAGLALVRLRSRRSRPAQSV